MIVCQTGQLLMSFEDHRNTCPYGEAPVTQGDQAIPLDQRAGFSDTRSFA